MSSSYKGPRASAKASTSSSSRTGAQEGESGLSNGDSKNNDSRQANLTKFAKYLQDDDSLKFDESSYKPTIRADRHQMGYVSSLNQRRNRANPGDASQTGSSTNEDPGLRRRPANRPHIRSYSLNRTAANSDATGRFSAFQKTSGGATDGATDAKAKKYPGENLFTRSKISTADVLEEEKPSNLPKTERSTYSFPAKEKMGSSSGNGKEKETSEPQFTRSSGETSSRTSRSRRSARDTDLGEKYRSHSGSTAGANENATGFETQDTPSDKTSSAKTPKTPGRSFFPTIDELPKASSGIFEHTQSTPKTNRKSSNLFDSEINPDVGESTKTFLTPDSCWNSKYFPPPYESSDKKRRPRSGNFDTSFRESPIKGDQEAESEFKFSPRLSSRNSVFEHLRTQESRERSHSLDGRNRTPSHANSPLSHSNRNSPSPQSGGSRRRSRQEQMNSLNESNFESKSAFKDHLLNLTMNKDEYEGIMSDFKNGSMVEDLDTKGTECEPNSIPEIVVEQADDISNKSDSHTGKESSQSNGKILNDSEEKPDNSSSEQSINICNANSSDEDAKKVENSNDLQENKENISNDGNNQSHSENEEKEKEAKEKEAMEKELKEKEAKEKELKEKEAKEKELKEKEAREKQEAEEREAKEREAKQKYFRLIEELIEAARTKYSSPDLQKTSESQVILEPVLSEQLTHKWRFQKTEFGIPTSMGVTTDGCVVVADYGNSCLEYFSASGDFEHKIDGVKPFGIVVNKKDNIIVGDRRGKAIRIFDKFGADVAQWESKTFGWISGIAILQNGHLAICDRDRCKIGIYTEGGEQITEFGSYGSSNSQLCMADFLAVDGKNRIIVADSGNHCLKLFDDNGKSIGKISSRGTENGHLEWPKGICVDKNDNIIVADMHNNRVSMFSTSGDFVEQLLSTTPNPYNVCYGMEAGILGILHYSLKGFSQYDVYTL